MSKVTVYEHLKACAEAAKSHASEIMSALAEAVAETIEELNSTKANKTNAVGFTIPTTGWNTDGSTDYPYYFDILVEGVSANDRAEITIAPGSLGTAKTCGLCVTNETMAGVIRVRSTSVPAAAIEAEYWIADGKE